MKDKLLNKKNIILIVTFIFVFILMRKIPLLGMDDYNLNSNSFNIKAIPAKIVSSIFNWNARSGQLLGYIIGTFPRIFFYIFNSIQFILFLYLIYYFSFSKKDRNKINMLLSFLVSIAYLFYLFPSTFDDFFWMSGSCNHLFAVCINLIFFIPFYKLFYDEKISFKNKYLFIIYIIIALLAGSSMENIWFFMIPVIIIDIINYKHKHKHENIKKEITIASSYGIGILYMLLAPSLIKRNNEFSIQNISNYKTGISKLIDVLLNFYKSNRIFLIIFITLLIVYFIYLYILKKKIRKEDKIHLFCFLFSTFTLIAFYFVPYYTSRALLLLSFFMLINCISILALLLKRKKILKLAIILFFLVINIYAYRYYYRIYTNVNHYTKLREISLLKQYKKNKKSINLYFPPCQYGERVIEYKKSNDISLYLKKYYKIKKTTNIRYQDNPKYKSFCIKYNRIFNIEYEFSKNDNLYS